MFHGVASTNLPHRTPASYHLTITYFHKKGLFDACCGTCCGVCSVCHNRYISRSFSISALFMGLRFLNKQKEAHYHRSPLLNVASLSYSLDDLDSCL